MLYILAIIFFVVHLPSLVKEIIPKPKILNDLYKEKPPEGDVVIRENAIRQLTEEEVILLKPYLDNEDFISHPYQWESSLISLDVMRITGYIEKDYPSVSHYDYYYKMGNLRIFFPYHMESRIKGFNKGFHDEDPRIKSDYINTAEVVLTKSYAIVVKINHYGLLEAGLNLYDRKERQIGDFWQTGKLKPIPLSSAESANETFTQLITEESEKVPTFEILNKRENNQFETAIEDRSNSGILMIALFVSGVMGLLFFEHFQSLVLVVCSIICFILSMIASVIKREIHTEHVNHIKAQIKCNWPSYQKLRIDTKFDVYYPEYWKPFLPKKSDIPIDMQIGIYSRQLLSCGDYLSISEEVKNYGAPKFIYHNVLLAITGLILTVLMFFFTNAIEKFDFTYHQLTAPVTTWQIDDEKNLKNLSIQSMDRINLDLSSVWCDINNMPSKKDDYLQCNKIFFNINPIDSSKLNLFPLLPQSIQEIYHSNIFKMKKDLEVFVMTRLKKKILDARIDNKPIFKDYPKLNQDFKNEKVFQLIKIYDIDKAILTFDDSCNHLNLEPCDRIKNRLAILLPEDSSIGSYNWSAVVDYAKSHHNIQKIEKLTSAENIDRLVAQYRKNVLEQFIFDAKEKIVMLQNDENNLSIQFTNSIQLYDKNYKNTYDNEMLKEQLDYYNGILLGNNANLKISGIVTNVSYHNGAVSKLTISTDPNYNFDKNQLFSFSSPILINNFVFLLVILITLINSILIIWKKIANQQRLQIIIYNYKNKIVKFTD